MPGDFLRKSKEDVAWCDHGKSNHLVSVRPGVLEGLLFLQMGIGMVAALLEQQQHQQRAISLSSWFPSCATAGSHPGCLGGLLRWSRLWGCSSLCDLGSATSRHGWVSLTKDCEGCLCKGCSQAEAMWD